MWTFIWRQEQQNRFSSNEKNCVEQSTQCFMLCTFATAIRSQGHGLSPSYPPLFLYLLLHPSNSDSIFSKSLFLPPRWGRHCSFVLLCSLAHPHYCTYAKVFKLLIHVSLEKIRLIKHFVLFCFASYILILCLSHRKYCIYIELNGHLTCCVTFTILFLLLNVSK